MSDWLRPGLHVLPAPTDTAALRSQAEAAGRQVCLLRGAHIASKRSFLAACAEALWFPDWFGGNWDALADSLGDLSWLPSAPRVIVWQDAAVLAAADGDAYDVALDVLRDATTWWTRSTTPLTVVLTGVVGPA